MKCGIVGLPNVGKSTLFNCLSEAKAQSANFPFCTIEPNLGMVQVPDGRLPQLVSLINPKNVVPAMVEIIDIAGLVRGAHKGEGLGNQFLSHIRETNAIIHMLRCFKDDNIIHVEGEVDPVRDKEIIDIELQLKDLELVVKKLDREKKNSKPTKNQSDYLSILERFKETLQSAKNLRELSLSAEEKELIKDMHLLTLKPMLYLCNVDESSLRASNAYVERLKEKVAHEGSEILMLTAQMEASIAELDTYEDKELFLKDLGLQEPGVNRLIRSVYTLLGLQTYFTAGEKEVRAWTIPKGLTAPQAASVIHSDFERGFIRAEVMHYDDFIKYKSEAKVREAGKLYIEGKDYLVQDGDIVHFRFNV